MEQQYVVNPLSQMSNLIKSFSHYQIIYIGAALTYVLGALRYGVGRYAWEVPREDSVHGLKVPSLSPFPSEGLMS